MDKKKLQLFFNDKCLNFNRRRGGKDNQNKEQSKQHMVHSKLSSKAKKYADFKGNINLV